jgi:hypothetical protein
MYDGDDVDVALPRGSSGGQWDLKLVDRTGASLVWPAVDLSKTSDVTLRLSRGKPYVEPTDDN